MTVSEALSKCTEPLGSFTWNDCDGDTVVSTIYAVDGLEVQVHHGYGRGSQHNGYIDVVFPSGKTQHCIGGSTIVAEPRPYVGTFGGGW
jgi:hypothetical protein